VRFSSWSVIAGFAVSGSVFAGLNYRNLFRRGLCHDCDLPYGLPFVVFRAGGFAHDARIVWPGLIGDLLLLVVGGAVIAWLFDWIFNAGKSPRTY
jgi:hypothetical protein